MASNVATLSGTPRSMHGRACIAEQACTARPLSLLCIETLKGTLSAAQASRERILAAEPDPAEMHSLLSNLPPLGAISADELAQSAVAIYRRCPPKQLLRAHRGIRLVTCAPFTPSCGCMV